MTVRNAYFEPVLTPRDLDYHTYVYVRAKIEGDGRKKSIENRGQETAVLELGDALKYWDVD